MEENTNNPSNPGQNQTPQMPRDVEIGFHQGALTTLSAERNELIKMVQTVEMIMGSHISRLEQLGVKVERKSDEKQGN